MGLRQFIALGTSSMAPTRYRAHNSYALRWDDQLVLFDPGEGTQRGCTLAGVAIARATAVCITHFHGDHCLGLPGVIQRRSIDNAAHPTGLAELPIFYPSDGQKYFDRLRHGSIFHDHSRVVERPVAEPGSLGNLGRLELSAAALVHRDTTYGYRLQEPDGLRVDPDKLAAFGIAGPDVGKLLADGTLETPNGTVGADQVQIPYKGQSMAFVMDTIPCDGAHELASGVDLLVIESTYLETETELATKYLHTTARQAATLAAEAGARRVVLTHFSARYPNNEVFYDEASKYHDDVVVAEDLLVVDVPERR